MFKSRAKAKERSTSTTRAVSGELIVQDYAGITVATIGRPSLLEARDIDTIARELNALIAEQAKRKLILDFTNVRQLSSQSIGMLLNLNKQAKAIDGTVALCGIRGPVARLFELTKLDAIFAIFKDDAAALASFGVHVT